MTASRSAEGRRRVPAPVEEYLAARMRADQPPPDYEPADHQPAAQPPTEDATRPRIDTRVERDGDEAAIAHVLDLAFNGPAESRIVAAARAAGHLRLSLVAEADGDLVGSVVFTPVEIESQGSQKRALGLGPMAVHPAWQRRGVGSRLVVDGLLWCARAGWESVVVLGHPWFYPRFGFRPAVDFGLRSEYPVPDEVFMALELTPGVLSGRPGLVRYGPEFALE